MAGGERGFPQASRIPAMISALGVLVILFSAWLAVEYSGQHILGRHSFRQTQTALTSFWVCRAGFKLAYETPVGGYPWSIPFEFPIYQYLVSLVSCPFGFDLERVGRLVSYGFLLGCLAPAAQIMRTLFGSSWRLHFWAFVALFISSPLYLFWGRSFLTETTGLFFSLYFIGYVIKLLQGDHRWWNAVFAGAFLLLALLQKATTALPLLAVFGLLFLLHSLSDLRASRLRSLLLWQGIVAFAIPFLIGYAWVKYGDAVKLHNALGTFLTSEALTRWNFGTLPARFMKELWLWVVWDRVVLRNISGLIGCTTLLIGLVFLRRDRALILLAIGIFLSYFLIFENLHFVHEYYQAANLVFLIFAVSIVVSRLIQQYPSSAWLPFLLFLILLAGNLWTFTNGGDYAAEKLKYDDNDPILAVSKFVQGNTDPKKPILIYGDDWSSEIPFYSERKSFAVPVFFSPYLGPIENPVQYLEQEPSAIIVCGDARKPDIEQRVGRFFKSASKTVIQTCEVYKR